MTAKNQSGQGPANLSNLLGWAAAAGQEAQELARRRRMLPLRLSAAERETCADELAEQYAVGRLDTSVSEGSETARLGEVLRAI